MTGNLPRVLQAVVLGESTINKKLGLYIGSKKSSFEHIVVFSILCLINDNSSYNSDYQTITNWDLIFDKLAYIFILSFLAANSFYSNHYHIRATLVA